MPIFLLASFWRTLMHGVFGDSCWGHHHWASSFKVLMFMAMDCIEGTFIFGSGHRSNFPPSWLPSASSRILKLSRIAKSFSHRRAREFGEQISADGSGIAGQETGCQVRVPSKTCWHLVFLRLFHWLLSLCNSWVASCCSPHVLAGGLGPTRSECRNFIK